MTFKEFWKILHRKYWILAVLVVVVLAGVTFFNSKTKNTYEGNIGFSIIRLGKSEANEFSDFYATQADNLVTANFTKWMKSKPFTAQVYQKAGIDLDKENLDNIIKKIDAVKVSGTDISYQYETYQRQQAEEIGTAVIEEVKDRTAQIKKSAKKDVNARGLEVSSKLSIHQKTTNLWLNYILGLLGGIALGFVILLVARYFGVFKR